MSNVSNRDAGKYIERLERFNSHTGSLRGEWSVDDVGTGVYEVYSYRTKIASYDTDGVLWINPSKYSSTTSRHQGIVRRALLEVYRAKHGREWQALEPLPA